MENKNPVNPGFEFRDTPNAGPAQQPATPASTPPVTPAYPAAGPAPIVPATTVSPPAPKNSFLQFARRYFLLIALLLITLVGIGLAVWFTRTTTPDVVPITERFGSIDVPLANVPGQNITLGGQALAVNGLLRMNNTLVLTPQTQPQQALAGQLYFDQNTSVLNYYNGTEFIELQGGGDSVATLTTVNNIGGGTVTSSGGTPGRIAKFTGPQNVQDSLLSESGATVTVHGNLHVQSNVGIGTDTPLRPAHILTNNTITDAPSFLIQQQGSGDSSLEFKTANNKSFFVGMDASSGGSFNIASSTSAAATIDVGESEEACCNSTTAVTNTIWAMRAVVGGTGGTLSSISVYTSSVDATFPGASVALYTDSGGFPGSLVANSNVQDLTVGWNTFSMSGSVNANTTYWLAYNFEGNSVRRFQNGTGNHVVVYNGITNGTWPNIGGAAPDVNSPGTTTPVYMTIVPTGAVDSFDGINVLSITDNGAATFQNSTDSGGAFRVLNADAVPQFVIDSAGDRIYIGNPTGDTTGALLVLDTKTNAGDPTGIDGAMYYNASAGRLRCHENGDWKNCISEQFLARGQRTTDATTTAINGVVRLDDIPLRAGRTYRISTSPLHLSSTVANDHGEVLVVHTTDGSIPTTASAILPGARAQAHITNTGFGETISMMVTYTPAGDETLSLLLCLQRADGSGTITLTGTNDFQIELMVEEVGDDVGDTGIDI